MLKTLYVMVGLFLALSRPAQAGVFWDETFETAGAGNRFGLLDNTGPVQLSTASAVSGSKSARYMFNQPQVGSCLPGHVNYIDCGGFYDATFTSTTNLWRRFLVRVNPAFLVASPTTKLTKAGTSASSDWITIGYNQRDSDTLWQLVMQPQTNVDPRLLFGGVLRHDGGWQCVETHQQLNTPGARNGVYELYLDDVRVANYTDVGWRDAGDNSLYNYVRLYRQYGSGDMFFDNYAVGDTRIGCGTTPPPPPPGGGGGGPLPDTSLPNAPTNLTVTELWERLKTVVASVWQWLGPVSAEAATAASDQVVIRWEPRPGQRFTIDLTGFGWSGAKTFADLDAGLGTLTVPLPGLPPGQPGDDRWLCATERDGKALPGCNQLALGPIVLPPPPVPEPEPDLIGPAIVTMSGDKVFIACDPARYTRAKTTGTGTKRTITCLP